MTAEAWPTEDAATRAVEAAARKWWGDRVDSALKDAGTALPPYDELSPLDKRNIGEAVLGLVWAALTALPDPRYDAWEVGYSAGWDKANEVQDSQTMPEINPYPAPSTPDFL